MSELVDFLRARLNEDATAIETMGDFIEEFNPERMLVDVESKRRIIDLIDVEVAKAHSTDFQSALMAVGAMDALTSAVALLALPYSDHPDYEAEWAPE